MIILMNGQVNKRASRRDNMKIDKKLVIEYKDLLEDVDEEQEVEEDNNNQDTKKLDDVLKQIDKKENQNSQTFSIKGTIIGLDPVTRINTIVKDNQVIFERKVNNTVRLKLDKTGSYSITLEDGHPITVIVGSGESNIHITQEQ